MISITKLPRLVNSWRQKGEQWLTGTGRWGMGNCFMETELVTVWEEEKVLKMDGGISCTTMCIYIMPLKCIVKNG